MGIDTKQRADVARPHPEYLWEHCAGRCDGNWCHRGWHSKAMCPRHTRCRIVRVIIKARIHEQDLAGHVTDISAFVGLNLPHAYMPVDLNADFDTTELRARQAARGQR